MIGTIGMRGIVGMAGIACLLGIFGIIIRIIVFIGTVSMYVILLILKYRLKCYLKLFTNY